MSEPGATVGGVGDYEPVIRFGDVDAGKAARRLRTQTSIEALPKADFRLDLSRTPDDVDYLAPLTIAMRDADTEAEIFQGSVLAAEPENGEIALSCAGGQLLVEARMRAFVSANMTAPEIAHVAASSAGLTEDRIRISGLDDLPAQVFEVVAALEGLEIVHPVELGAVRLLPPGHAEGIVEDILENPDGEGADTVDAFLNAPAHALVLVTGSVPGRAEREGLEIIDWVLAWLTTRVRYGLVRLPGGRAQPFTRAQARAQPRRTRLVAIRGLRSGGRWVRDAVIEPTLGVAGQAVLSPASVPTDPPPEIRNAFLAARRAATEGNPIQRVTALWEAIEFILKKVKVPRVLTPSERRAVRRELVAALPEEQHERIDRLLQLVNDAPVMHKLKLLVQQDGVPMSDGDLSLLEKLRDLRNTAVHGKGDELTPPSPEDLEHAVALLSRLLLHRIHALDQMGTRAS